MGGCLVMASNHKQRRSRRDELLPALGEDLGAWTMRVRLKAVINPLELAEERRRQEAARKRIASRSRRRIRRAARWLIGSLLALAAFVTLHQVAGLSWWLIFASVIAVVIGIGAVARANRLLRSDAAAHITPGLAVGQDQIVRLTELDEVDRALLQRARQAVDQVLSYPDAPDNLSDGVGLGVDMREQEWRLASRLRDAARLRAACGADPATA